MAPHRVEIEARVRSFLDALDAKSRRICVANLKKLAQSPYPGRGKGDKERLVVRGEDVYRLHIGRTLTAFYVILPKERIVRVLELLPIDQARKLYGYD